MNGLKDLGMLMAATTIAATLLTLFFDWRARWRGHLRGGSQEH